MKTTTIAAVAIVALTAAGWVAGAKADSSAAVCQVRKKGKVDEAASGPCSFSQRQGNVDITLKNGGSYNLSPGKRANHFKDQNGHGVERTTAGDTQTYKWEHMRIVVSFGGAAAGGSQAGAADMGGTPADLKDLVNSRFVGGEVDDELTRRGYTSVKNEVSGDEVYSYWKSKKGQCVTVRLNASRHVASIVSGPPADCQ
jgi:hypothetical protein